MVKFWDAYLVNALHMSFLDFFSRRSHWILENIIKLSSLSVGQVNKDLNKSCCVCLLFMMIGEIYIFRGNEICIHSAIPLFECSFDSLSHEIRLFPYSFMNCSAFSCSCSEQTWNWPGMNRSNQLVLVFVFVWCVIPSLLISAGEGPYVSLSKEQGAHRSFYPSCKEMGFILSFVGLCKKHEL